MPKKDINEYIPKYIKEVPVFLRDDNDEDIPNEDYLAHHRNGELTGVSNAEPKIGQGIKDEFIINTTDDSINTKNKVKRGKCSNCGGNHDVRDCLERPKIKNKLNNDDLKLGKGQRTEQVDYDGKRDRWFGYDVNDYNKFLNKWTENKEINISDKDEENNFDTDEEIELKELGLWEEYKKEGIKKKEGEKTVRLREDKAVYLKDFKNEEMTYDPKSRMIRDDTTGYYNEDNLFVRKRTGDALKLEQSETRSAWDNDFNNKDKDKKLINPIEINLQEDKKVKKLSIKGEKIKMNLMDRYNSNDNEELIDNDIENQQSVSKYIEDVLINGHTSVFGSFYKKGTWGFKCCQQTDPNSVCNR